MSWNQSRSRPSDAPVIEYLDSLYGYARILVRNSADAENLVHETCVSAIEPMGGLRASDRKLRLFAVLRDLWLKQYRDLQTKAQDEVGNESAATSASFHAPRAGNGEAESMQAAIQELPTELREIVFLREYEDLSPQQIAVLLNCPAETVTPQLGRARRKLCAALAAFNGPISSQGKNRQKGISSASSLLFFSRTELS